MVLLVWVGADVCDVCVSNSNKSGRKGPRNLRPHSASLLDGAVHMIQLNSEAGLYFVSSAKHDETNSLQTVACVVQKSELEGCNRCASGEGASKQQVERLSAFE